MIDTKCKQCGMVRPNHRMDCSDESCVGDSLWLRLSKAEAERDQLAAEMAEARKTVDALAKQVAALRLLLEHLGPSVRVGARHSPPCKPEDGIFCGACRINAALADTAAVAAGFVALDSEEMREFIRDCIYRGRNHPDEDTVTSAEQCIANFKASRSAR